MAHPEPRTTEEWLIDIYSRVESIDRTLSTLPCVHHDHRISELEQWRGALRANARLAGKITGALIAVAGLAVAVWRGLTQ